LSENAEYDAAKEAQGMLKMSAAEVHSNAMMKRIDISKVLVCLT
jgi:transcription elongation GreA/GreB family factor